MNHDSTDMNQMHEKETFIWEVHDFKKLLCVRVLERQRNLNKIK